MVLIVPLVGPSAFGVVFVWFSYGFGRFSYGVKHPSLVGLSALNSFVYGFPMVL